MSVALCECAAQTGNFEVLKWLRSQNYFWDSETCTNAYEIFFCVFFVVKFRLLLFFSRVISKFLGHFSEIWRFSRGVMKTDARGMRTQAQPQRAAEITKF